MFTERLQLVREWGGLNQAELSRLCGFLRTYISSVERDPMAEVGRSRLVALALTLGVSLDWLVLGRGKPPTEQAVRAAIEHARCEPGMLRATIDEVLGVQPKVEPRGRARRRPSRAKPLPRRAPSPALEARP